MQVIEGVETVFESPSSPKAVLLLFHGCRHSSTDWWPESQGCPACTGIHHACHSITTRIEWSYHEYEWSYWSALHAAVALPLNEGRREDST